MMHDLILGFPQQLQNAVKIGQKIQFSEPKHEIRNVLVAGLGGSGIGANLVEVFVADKLKVPYSITKTYDIPRFVDEHTLFIASSFSGNTEETLAALEKAQKRKAHIFCLTSGGKALEIAQKEGYDYVQVPNEAPCPRAFLGLSLTQLLFVLKGYKLINGFFSKDLKEAIELLNTNQTAIQTQAKTLAHELYGKSPILYSDIPFGPNLVRFQQQINENAKQLCHVNVFPEMNHNELVGWGLLPEVYQYTAVIMVRSDFDHPRVSHRMDICHQIFAKKAANVITIQPLGTSFIAQNIYLIHLFDWVSYYLAELNQVDSFEIDVINYLKSELAKI